MASSSVINGTDVILTETVDSAVSEWLSMAAALRGEDLRSVVLEAGRVIVSALAEGSKVLVLGNGGSAAMASHVAAELTGKCIRDRQPLPAISLADSSAAITAIGNDYGFEHVFTRSLRALGSAGDVLIAMSTSGSSRNVLAALREARSMGITTVLLTGLNAPEDVAADFVLRAPSDATPRIQEIHLLWTHAWCEAIDTVWATQH